MNGEAIRELESAHGIPTYSQIPISIVRGEGAHVWDAAGRRYLDFYGGHAVALLGHCPPRVVEALREQSGRLLFYSNVASNDVRARALADLAGTAPEEGFRVFLCNSGTEANEAALKLARRTTGRRKVVSMEGGFHGRTLGSLSATPLSHYLDDYAPGVPGHVFAPFGDLEAAAELIDDDTASVLLEPVQSMAGMCTATGEYLQGLRELCDRHGALLHFDEVQTGPARTGTWWYGDHHGVVPDLISTAKGLAAGVPAGAVLVRGQVAARVRPGDQGTTFGGGMLACAAISAVIQSVRDDDLLANATARGSQLRTACEELDGVTETRGRGMLVGVVLDRAARPVVADMRARGVLCGTTVGDPNVLRVLAPITVSSGDVDAFVSTLRDSLAEPVGG